MIDTRNLFRRLGLRRARAAVAGWGASSMARIPIQSRIVLLSLLGAVVALTMTALEIHGLRAVSRAVDHLASEAVPELTDDFRAAQAHAELQNSVKSYVVARAYLASHAELEALRADILGGRVALRRAARDIGLSEASVDGYLATVARMTGDTRYPLDRIGADMPVLLAAYADVAEEIAGNVDRAGALATSASGAARDAYSVTTALAFALGAVGLATVLILGPLIGGSITREIRAAAEALMRLAGGERDVPTGPVQRDDAIGDMARALEVFRRQAGAAEEAARLRERQAEADKAETAARLAEAERRRRADAAAQAEAEAREARERALLVEVAELVSAAAAGDLSRRIAADGVDGVLHELCEGINAVVDRVRVSVDELSELLRAMADGDMTVRATAEGDGVFARLARDANATAARLDTMIGTISDTSDAVTAETGDLTRASADLSERTETAAATLEESATALDRIDHLVHDSAAASREGAALASRVRDDASAGRAVVSRAVAAMGAIAESSHRVSTITDLLDEIAFQTNLLALNAGVEAARAGPAGRGFSVVASEVRALARRTAEAASEIDGIVDEAGRQVEGGVALVAETDEGLSAIDRSVEELAALMATLTESMEDQAAGIREVSRSVTELDGVTQANAAMQEEMTAATRALAGEAEGLADLVRRFRYRTDVPPHAPDRDDVHGTDDPGAEPWAGRDHAGPDDDDDGNRGDPRDDAQDHPRADDRGDLRNDDHADVSTEAPGPADRERAA